MTELTKENLLDNFAIEAMKTLIVKRDNDSRDAYRMAGDAYFIAERMLEQREKILSQWVLDKEVVRKTNEEIERDSIDNLCLTIRAQNCLRAEGIITITQLQKCTEGRLMKIKNLGRKSLSEIIEQMASLGYRLRDYT
jgi:DNA-directed RNA polymerase alpha subunit